MKKMIYALALISMVYAQKHNINQRAFTNSEFKNSTTDSRGLSIPKTLLLYFDNFLIRFDPTNPEEPVTKILSFLENIKKIKK